MDADIDKTDNDDDDDDDCGAFGPHCVISRLMFVGAVGCSMLIV